MNRLHWRCFVAAAGVLALAGCGKSTGTLAGKATLNGEPVSFGQLAAYNDKEELQGATTILNGEYLMGDIPPGPVTLVVQTVGPDGKPVGLNPQPPQPPGARPLPPEIAKENMFKGVPDEVRKAAEGVKPVPLKYISPKNSDLKATVVKGTTTYDIQMTGKGELPKAPPPPSGGPPGPPGGPPGGPPLPPRP